MHYNHKIHNVRKRLPQLFIITLMAVVLSACSHSSEYNVKFESPPPVKSRQVICQPAPLAHALHDAGILVTQLGDMVQLNAAANQLFISQSANPKPGFTALIHKITHYIQCYPVRHLTVSVYGANDRPVSVEQALTSKRAQKITNALVSQGLQVRIINSIGYGVRGSISSNKTAAGRATNKRVSIRFWRQRPREGLL